MIANIPDNFGQCNLFVILLCTVFFHLFRVYIKILCCKNFKKSVVACDIMIVKINKIHFQLIQNILMPLYNYVSVFPTQK